jgi:chorismate synthase
MNGNRFGTLFQVSTWGESHGPSLGALVDGCPSGLKLSEDDFTTDMLRRQGGALSFTTARKEADRVHIESGVFEGRTIGTPICLRIVNEAQNSADYENYRNRPRPGHADLTTFHKQGHRDHRGGGRSSARETAARTAAGVVAKRLLAHQGVDLFCWLERAGPNILTAEQRVDLDLLPLSELRARSLASPIGCPVPNDWAEQAAKVKSEQDSWGGSVRCRVEGLPPGLGEPVFDKLGALLAHGMMSLPASVAFEAGGGLEMAAALGSRIRDPIGISLRPDSNIHRGLLGGMSSGKPLYFGVSFHAPTSIPRKILSIDLETGKPVELEIGGRHDSFPLPRILPVVEAMAAITIADCFLRAGRIPEKL